MKIFTGLSFCLAIGIAICVKDQRIFQIAMATALLHGIFYLEECIKENKK